MTHSPSQFDPIDAAVNELMARVGDRVRKARERKGIPRRVLSENSGVSPRYLAQLEAGEGNISIVLLQRVAMALDYKIDWLISEEDPYLSEALQVADLFRRSTADKRAQVMAILNPQPAAEQRAQRICLVGLRGAGKSTLGALAGEKLGVPFMELNREIELVSGMPVEEVMALYGQEGYRDLEAEALRRIAATHERVILAVAGGIVAEPQTYNELLGKFNTIWVRTSPEEHMSRVRAQGDERPMANNPEAMQQLQSILKAREVLYERAQFQLDTSHRSVSTSLSLLLGLIKDNGLLDA